MKKYLTILSAVLVMMFGHGAVAQNGYMSILTIKANPGTDQRINQIMPMVIEAVEATETPLYFYAMESMSGEKVFSMARPLDSFADLDIDIGPALEATFEEDDLIALTDNLNTMAASMHTTIYNMRQDLSREPPESDTPPDAVISVDLEIANGRQQAFEAFVSDLVTATDEVDPESYWIMMSPAYSTNHYKVLILVDDWADLDTPASSLAERIMGHFGERVGTMMMDDSQSNIVSAVYTLHKTRADLARPPM